jgi:hypothetical protein
MMKLEDTAEQRREAARRSWDARRDEFRRALIVALVPRHSIDTFTMENIREQAAELADLEFPAEQRP